jgi:hypothetical protein
LREVRETFCGESDGVSENPPESPFGKRGTEGVGEPRWFKEGRGTVPAGFASLCPPYGCEIDLPESAGRSPCRGLGCPLFPSSSPKIGGPRGLKEGCKTVLAGFALPAATVPWAAALDSRLRGNDRGGSLLMASLKLAPTRVWPGVCRGAGPLCRGFGGSPSFRYSIPQEWGIKGVDETQPGAYQVVR